MLVTQVKPKAGFYARDRERNGALSPSEGKGEKARKRILGRVSVVFACVDLFIHTFIVYIKYLIDNEGPSER